MGLYEYVLILRREILEGANTVEEKHAFCPKIKHNDEACVKSTEQPGHMNFTRALKTEKTAANTGAGEVVIDLKVTDGVTVDSCVTMGQQLLTCCVCKLTVMPYSCEGQFTGVKAMSCGDCTRDPSDCSTRTVTLCTCDPCGTLVKSPDGCGNPLTGAIEQSTPLETDPDKTDCICGTDTITAIIVNINEEGKVSSDGPGPLPVKQLTRQLCCWLCVGDALCKWCGNSCIRSVVATQKEDPRSRY